MKSRKEVIDHIHSGALDKSCNDMRKGAWHFGLVEMRKLLDFIYEGEPGKDEELKRLLESDS